MPNTTVLLVDDDALQLSLLEIQLHNLDYTDVVLSQSGTEALAAFERLGADIGIILSDLYMPDMDGLVLMRHLAQRGFSGSFMLLSSSRPEILTSAAGLAQAHGLDLLGVLSKPCPPKRLGAMLGARKPAKVGVSDQGAQFLALRTLAQALADQEFVPWYQPKIDIHTGMPISVEALARWPVAAIGPGVFVPAIESCGLADDLFFCHRPGGGARLGGLAKPGPRCQGGHQLVNGYRAQPGYARATAGLGAERRLEVRRLDH